MIKYSVEQLHHFMCLKCSMWWSIGDFVMQKIKCPYCGHEDFPSEIENE